MDHNMVFLILGVILLIVVVIVGIVFTWKKAVKRDCADRQGYQIAAISAIGRRSQQQDALWFSGMNVDARYLNDRDISGTACETGKDMVAYSFVHREDECMAVIADGMGGLQNGSKISRMIVNETREAFFCTNKPQEPVAFMQNMLWKVNERVNHFLAHEMNGRGGSTDITVYIKDRMLYYLSVGDSRVYLIRKNHENNSKSKQSSVRAEIKKINLEHNFGTELDILAKDGIISETEARENPQRAALTSYIGIGELVKVDGNPIAIPLREGDVVMLMSDGIYTTVDEEELLACAMARDSMKIVSQIGYLIEKKEKMRQDNYSVIAIRVL